MPPPIHVLTLNVGSSSIRFAFFAGPAEPRQLLTGRVERVGEPGTTLIYRDAADGGEDPKSIALSSDRQAASGELLDWLEKQREFQGVAAIAHRFVHGGADNHEPREVTAGLLDELQRLVPLDPDHLPAEIALAQEVGRRFARVAQVACFDTAFHADLPRVARVFAVPRRLEKLGVRRYGFHGLSYTFLLERLRQLDPGAAAGRVILAHLGGGASLAAVREGKCIDTSMALTPASGLPMGTRSGDVDPGLFGYLARTTGMTVEAFDDMINHESGLLGVSETSSDMRELLAHEQSDGRAAEAVALYCYQARKWIGAYAAALGGLDTLVFAGGVGENASPVRARICGGLEFLGLSLDAAANSANAAVISAAGARVTVRVVPTDEELVLARAAFACAARVR